MMGRRISMNFLFRFSSTFHGLREARYTEPKERCIVQDEHFSVDAVISMMTLT